MSARTPYRMRERGNTERAIAVRLDELREILCIGRNQALKVGRDSGAAFKIGGCTLYNVRVLQEYIDRLTEEYQKQKKEG